MLNTPTDYNTFDRVTVKKALRNNTYKWSCLVVTLLLCALMVIMWYWNGMMETPQKLVKMDRSVRASNNQNASTDKSELLDHIRETLGVASEKGEVLVSTLIDEAEEIGNQIKAGADSLKDDGAEIVDSTRDQLKQIADEAAVDLAHLATEVADELQDVVATALHKIDAAAAEAKESVQNAAASSKQ